MIFTIRSFYLFVFASLSLFSSYVFAIESFKVEDIRIEGIQRISAGTVFNYLPIKIGQTVTDESASKGLHELYKTGFFKNVSFEVEDQVLIVYVVERPAITSITFVGNEEIETADLQRSLKAVGFAEGQMFNESLLIHVVAEMERQYFSLGRYAVRIDSHVTPLERNRVSIKITISEGKISKIKKINIVGNGKFSEKEILEEMELTTPTTFSWYTKRDQYSKEKLSGDLEKIRSFYMDKGFINFSIDSTQVSITPDRNDVYVTINVSEGEQFYVDDIKLSGDLIVAEEKLRSLFLVKQGDVFSRLNVAKTNQAIMEALGDEGYAFANVKPIPNIDNKTKKVKLNFFVDPGKRTYVRRINIFGNTITADHVLRRELRQQESAWLSSKNIQRSKERLDRLGFFKSVKVESKPVLGSSDLVDVEYTVEEQSTGSINAGVRYSQTEGVIFNFSISQKNFLGTGNTYSVGLDNSQVNTMYHFSMTDPYFTDDGIGRTWYMTHKRTDQNQANLSQYNTTRDAVGIRFSIPVNEFNSYGIGLDVERLRVSLPSDTLYTSQDIIDFITTEGGDNYFTFKINGSWAHDSRNRAIFPDRGTLMRVSADLAVPGSKYKYYKLSYKQVQYFPVSKSLTLMLSGKVAKGGVYSGDFYPPFENYYSGGIGSVRGFRDNTLGERDIKTNKAIGGSFLTTANAELIFPVPFIKDSNGWRISAFMDAGNVFGDVGKFDAKDLRYSAGIATSWLSPFGLLQFSLGKALNAKSSDEKQFFQFTFGQQF